MKFKILLIGTKDDPRWEKIVRNAAVKLQYSLDVALSTEIESVKSWKECDLVILDSSGMNALSSVISSIRLQNFDGPIVVVSPAPGWQEAKEVLQAGAIDYHAKSSREKDMLIILKNHLIK
jgi:DNA-binding response OmpR family regulator